jgi:hypothetical protein
LVGYVFTAIFLWALLWLAYRFRGFLFAKLPSGRHALLFLTLAGLALLVALVALVERDAAHARTRLPAISTLAEFRELPAGAEMALVGRVSSKLPLAFYDRYVVYTEHGNPATDALLSGTAALTIAVPDGEIEFANTSYRIANWHGDGQDGRVADSVYGLMRDDPVVVHAERAGEGTRQAADRVFARRVVLGSHEDYARFERRSVAIHPYAAVALLANALGWAAFSIAGFLAARRRVRVTA